MLAQASLVPEPVIDSGNDEPSGEEVTRERSLRRQQFVRLCELFGYRILPQRDGVLFVAGAKPSHVRRFFPAEVRGLTYSPEGISNPRRRRCELRFRP